VTRQRRTAPDARRWRGVVLATANWSFNPGAILLLAIVTTAYVRRWREVRREQGTLAMPAWRLFVFLCGIAAVAAALISPVDALAHDLFVMHMVQHLLLLDVAPILCILGLTKVLLRPVTRRIQRLERAAGPIGHPVFAIVFYVVAMWSWHIPALYDAALRHPGVHVLEHLTFGCAGFLYWWHLLSPIRSRQRLGGMGPIVYMLSTKLLVGLLGIALTFAPDPWYSHYHGGTWGLTAEEDEQIAGALMAIEQSIVMGIALAWLFVRMLEESQRADERAERYERV
jgi:cytochrome c oxidase assembly factor CtaG